MKRIIASIIVLLFITGCGKNSQLDEVSEAIINYHSDYNYDISDLNDYNKQILSRFKEKEKRENKVINISKLDLFSDDITTTEPDSKGVYKKDENYYIKYDDLYFEKVNETDFIATINVNGYIINLSKSNFPILFEETSGTNYQYRFMNKEKKDNIVNYYYRSYGNGSMLTIEYTMNGNKIENIDLKYDDYYLLDNIEPYVEKKSNFGYIIFIVLIFSALVFVGIRTYRKYLDYKKV